MATARDSVEVTAVVPTRNRPRMLRQTLRAILQQDAALEVVVVDDASDDPAASDVAGTDGRVRVLRQPRQQGVSAARNAGVAAARGEFVAFCDDDDLWAPDKLARQLEAVRADAAAWVIAGALEFRDSDGVVERAISPLDPEATVAKLPYTNVVPGGCSGVIARRADVQRAGGFTPELRIMADWDLWLRLAQVSAPAVVDDHLVGYRLHRSNMSKDDSAIAEEIRRLEARTLQHRGGQPFPRAWVEWKLGNAALHAGKPVRGIAWHARAALHGHPRAARRAAATAILGSDTRRRSLVDRYRQRGAGDVQAAWLARLVDDQPRDADGVTER